MRRTSKAFKARVERQLGPHCEDRYNYRMSKDDEAKRDDATAKDRDDASETDKKSGRTDKDDSGKDEGELTAITPKTREPSDNLRRRAEWFQKRHGRG